MCHLQVDQDAETKATPAHSAHAQEATKKNQNKQKQTALVNTNPKHLWNLWSPKPSPCEWKDQKCFHTSKFKNVQFLYLDLLEKPQQLIYKVEAKDLKSPKVGKPSYIHYIYAQNI